MNKTVRLLVVCAFAIAVMLSGMAASAKDEKNGNNIVPVANGTQSLGTSAKRWDVNADGISATGVSVFTTANITTLTPNTIIGPAYQNVSITSPTLAFNISGKGSFVTLNTDTNQTSNTLTGGTLNQIVFIKTGTGSNTMGFDDGTSFTIGANVTLTESQGDIITLQCTSADGDEWVCLSAHDN